MDEKTQIDEDALFLLENNIKPNKNCVPKDMPHKEIYKKYFEAFDKMYLEHIQEVNKIFEEAVRESINIDDKERVFTKNTFDERAEERELQDAEWDIIHGRGIYRG